MKLNINQRWSAQNTWKTTEEFIPVWDEHGMNSLAIMTFQCNRDILCKLLNLQRRVLDVATFRVHVDELFEVVKIELSLDWGNHLFKVFNAFASQLMGEHLVDVHKFGVSFDVICKLFATLEPVVILHRHLKPMANHRVILPEGDFIKVLASNQLGEVDGLTLRWVRGLLEIFDRLL